MKKKIAFLTYQDAYAFLKTCPDFLDEYALLRPYFNDFDSDLFLVDWQDKSINWREFDLVIPRRCWNYSDHHMDFNNLIQQFVHHRIKVRNVPSTILWNMNKSYLIDLKNKGLPVGELSIIYRNNTNYIHEISHTAEKMMSRSPLSFFIAKPTIGAAGIDVIKFAADQIQELTPIFKRIHAYSDIIIQPYFPEVALDGEYSYFFIGESFSHAVRKKPAEGNYLALQRYGAENMKHKPSSDEIIKAQRFVRTIQPSCDYARVDVFKRDHELYLLELELIEPYLYFEHAPSKSIIDFCQSVLS